MFLFTCKKSLSKIKKIEGPFEVKNKPPCCEKKSSIEEKALCVVTSGAMIMRYWSILKILKKSDCSYYQNALKEKLKSDDGSLDYSQRPKLLFKLIKVAKENLSVNAKNNLKISMNNVHGGIIPFNDVRFIDMIKSQIKYSLENDNKSPWDRVLLMMNGKTREIKNKYRNHAVLVWGYKIEIEQNKKETILYIRYKINDPNWKQRNCLYRQRDWLIVKINVSKYIDKKDKSIKDIYNKLTGKLKMSTQFIYIYFNKSSDCKKNK